MTDELEEDSSKTKNDDVGRLRMRMVEKGRKDGEWRWNIYAESLSLDYFNCYC